MTVPLLLIILILSLIPDIESTITCSDDEGAGTCPDGEKCCRINDADGTITSGCIPHNPHLKGDGMCCNDTIRQDTGCAGYYYCDHSILDTGENDYYCSYEEKDTSYRMPRYNLIPSSEEQIGRVHGFPLTDFTDDNKNSSKVAMAYYSSVPFILTAEPDPEIDEQIEVVVVVVHGSVRNADEYLYSAIVSSEIQQKYPPENVVVISPRFLATEDGVKAIPVKTNTTYEMMQPLLWNETNPIPHTWRYGANALSSNISSFDAMDSIIEHFVLDAGEGNRYSNLKRIAVIGHSAGGQYTHRWALTSCSVAWGDRKFNFEMELSTSRQFLRKRELFESNLPSIRVVVANPRSYCYLDSRRFVNGTFQVPSESMRELCPGYDEWQWGLDDGELLPAPYKDRALDVMGGDRSKLANRYASRNVIYLSGNNDTDILRSSCEDDDFQGRFRRERSKFFFNSLQDYFGHRVHDRLLIENVGHDHRLMFESKEGIEAIFG